MMPALSTGTTAAFSLAALQIGVGDLLFGRLPLGAFSSFSLFFVRRRPRPNHNRSVFFFGRGASLVFMCADLARSSSSSLYV